LCPELDRELKFEGLSPGFAIIQQAMSNEYIEQRDGGYYFASSRVSLDSVVYQFLQGESPESIAQAFPSLSLEQVYGGLTFYLANRQTIDEYLTKGEENFAKLANDARQANPLLYEKLRASRSPA
jgi:uncharacterized protein (DUF433 family)